MPTIISSSARSSACISIRLSSRTAIVQITEIQPIARCGWLADYTVLDELFQMTRPR